MSYNYHNAVVADTEELIREDLDSILEHFEAESLEDVDRDDLRSYIEEKAWEADSVTGNGSGSRFCNAYKAGEALLGNDGLIAEALDELGGETRLGSESRATTSTEYLDLTVRCSEVYRSVDEAIDNVIESPDKQVAEEILADTDYNSYGYEDEVRKAVEEYITDEIDTILETVDVNSVEDYKYSENEVEDFVFNKIIEGEADIPLPSDRDVIHHLGEVFNNENFIESGYTVQDYFSKSDVERTVKENYAQSIALEQVSTAIDNTYEGVIKPALEEREEQNMDRE